MAVLKCSECNGEVRHDHVNNKLICNDCGRFVVYKKEEHSENVQTIDLNDKTKDLDILLE